MEIDIAKVLKLNENLATGESKPDSWFCKCFDMQDFYPFHHYNNVNIDVLILRFCA